MQRCWLHEFHVTTHSCHLMFIAIGQQYLQTFWTNDNLKGRFLKSRGTNVKSHIIRKSKYVTKIFSPAGQKWQTQNLQTSDGVKRLRLNFCHDAYDDCHNSLVDIRRTSHYFFYLKHLLKPFWQKVFFKDIQYLRSKLIWGMPGSLMRNPQKYW